MLSLEEILLLVGQLNFRCLWGLRPHKHLKFSNIPILAE